MTTTAQRIVEPLGPGLSRVWDLSETLLDTRTDYQHVVIARTAQGISLFCDNDRQSTEASQLVYHEAAFVPAALLAGHVRDVLVIGSSEGVLSRLAVAFGARRVDHVDIDRAAVRACAELLPYGYRPDELAAAERGEGPVKMHYRDGWTFLAEAAANGDTYDVVAIDLPDENTDPDAQHNRLYETDFLRRCTGVLAEGGVLTCQAGCPTLWRNETLIAASRRFAEIFGTVVYFGSDEHEWAFLSGRTDRVTGPVDRIVSALPEAAYQPSTMDAETLRGGTVPPHSVRRALLTPSGRPGHAG